jgi:hypothetical protein
MKYSDSDILRELESGGRTLADWSAEDGLYYYRERDGVEYVVLDDNDSRATAVINFLLRHGRRRENGPNPTT